MEKLYSNPGKFPYWRISDPPLAVLEGNDGGIAVVLSEELWRNVRGTRLGGIGRTRQTQGEFMGGMVERYSSYAIPPPFPLSIARGNCRDCQGIMGELQGLFRMRGNGKDSLSCGGIARASLQGNCGGSLGEAGGA
ncbi:TPA: hypothetical protein ACH3X2_005454 [Trebouxia sp. C0005]